MIRRSSLIFTRSISTSFSLPVNKTLEILKATNANFEGLFTNNAINQLWFQRGQQLVQNLNQHLAQTNNGLLSDSNNINNNTSSTSDNGNGDGENVVNYSLNEIISITMNKPELFHIHKNATNLYNLQFFENIRQLEQQPQEIIPSGSEVLLQTPKRSI